MADLEGSIKLAEQRNARVTITPASGTITISSAVCTIYDAGENVAGGVSGATATFDAGALAAPRVWFKVRPTVLNLPLGFYVIAFKVTDSNGFVYEPSIGFEVRANSS